MDETQRLQWIDRRVLAATAALLALALALPEAGDLARTLPAEIPAPVGPSNGVSFERNEGQAEPSVAFIARSGNQQARIYKDGSLGIGVSDGVRLNPMGARLAPAKVASPLHTVNYIKGNDPRNWQTGVRAFAEVRFERVYPRVDLVYHGKNGQLEYDFVLEPGADLSDIVMNFDGALALDIAPNGDLVVTTPHGSLRQSAPIAIQQGTSPQVAYRLLGRTSFGFDVRGADPARRLTIDPVLKLSTLLGGDGGDESNAIFVGPDGSIYVIGTTTSTDFPTDSPFQTDQTSLDAFVTRFAPNGKTIIWSTYLGGNSDDYGHDVVVRDGRLFMTGTTYSTNFPMGVGTTPHQANLAGNGDAWFATLNGDGQSIEYSTYYGGTEFDFGLSVDAGGNFAYMSGSTNSDDLTVPDAYQGVAGGELDAFLVRLDLTTATAGVVDYGTYLGSTGDDQTDVGGALFVRNGLAYMTGATTSSGFPTTGDAHDDSFGGDSDAFISVFDLSQETEDSLVHSTFVGGGGFEDGDGLTLDGSGNVYVVGETSSANIATTSNAFDKAPARADDGWLIKLRSNGFTKAFLTLLGGNEDDELEDIAVDGNGNVYVVGETESLNFPTTVDRLAKGSANEEDQLTATKFNKTGSKILWSTGFGGSLDEVAESAFLKGSHLFIAGDGDGSIPTTNGAFQRTPGDTDNSDNDAFVLRLAPSKFHGRKVALQLDGHLQGEATVTVPDGANICRGQVPVKFQRKNAGKWKTVASGKTNQQGKVTKQLDDKPGDYRALASLVKKQGTAHICKASTSPAKEHRE